jgi:hypothetical protein
MSLVTGNQLKAARALGEMDQQTLATKADVNVNTIRNMEARGSEPITSGLVTVRKVQLVLEARGVEFLNHGEPGVRLRKRPVAKMVAGAGLARTSKKSSEMAGEAIDRLGDKSAPVEEQARRKRRLIKGPPEFREMRGQKPKARRPTTKD